MTRRSPPLYKQIQSFNKSFAPQCDRNILRRKNLVVRRHIEGEAELQIGVGGARCFCDLHFLKLLAPALGHFCGGGAHQITRNIIFQLRGFLHIRIMLLLLKRHSRLFLRKISGIIPLICCKRIVLDFENAVADSIKKITVVAHHQNRARIGFEIAFQPFHRLKIQMVCRLVQNQKIRLLQQQLGKAKSGMLAAGEHSHAFLIIRRGKSHAIQYLF